MEHTNETHMHKLQLVDINNDIFLNEGPWHVDNFLIAVHLWMAQTEASSSFSRNLGLLFNDISCQGYARSSSYFIGVGNNLLIISSRFLKNIFLSIKFVSYLSSEAKLNIHM